MPRLDRTGPNGQGPRTGRGAGNCNTAKPTKNKSIRPVKKRKK